MCISEMDTYFILKTEIDVMSLMTSMLFVKSFCDYKNEILCCSDNMCKFVCLFCRWQLAAFHMSRFVTIINYETYVIIFFLLYSL